jgi:hypothetical protein
MRIYVDESGTHSDHSDEGGPGPWLVIGMLFVPDHAALHSDLCAVKEKIGYYNTSSKDCRYKETHFSEFKSPRDLDVARSWIDVFFKNCTSVFRSIVIDWSLYQGKYFGTANDPDALKKRRAYKKWAEMLLQPEVGPLRGATFYLDHLRIVYGYDVIQHLEERFNQNYRGSNPRIKDFQAVSSWKDAHQCLQLCDLLVGAVYHKLVPGSRQAKHDAVNHLYEGLKKFGVKERSLGYWRSYSDAMMNKHFPKFSEWYWRPA